MKKGKTLKDSKNLRNKGITLVALVVTLILLILLAGITVNLVLGNNGFIEKSQNVAENQKITEITGDLKTKALQTKMKLLGSKEDLTENYLEKLKDESLIEDKDIDEEKGTYITLEDKYVYSVEEKRNNLYINYEGKVGELLPKIVKIDTTNTTDDITVEVTGKWVDTYKFYLKEKENDEYTEYESNTTGTYMFENLDQNKLYYIKVVVINENGENSSEFTRETEIKQYFNVQTIPYLAPYDGELHGIEVACEQKGAKITYSEEENGDYSSTKPVYDDVGEYITYFKVKLKGYWDYEGYEVVTITRAKTATVTATNKTYNTTEQTGVTGTNVTLIGDIAATNAGTYTAKATPTSNYAWEDGTYDEKEIEWTIAQFNIASATLSNITAYNYTGDAKTPEPTVTVNINGKNQALEEGEEFTYSYSDNTNPTNVATVTATGKGNYTGTASKAFTINPVVTYNNNNGTGTMASQNVTYNTDTALTVNTFTRTGYTFSGWNTTSNGTGTSYADKANIKVTQNTTLYAVWTPNELIFANQSIEKTYSTSAQTASITGASNGTGTYTYSEVSETKGGTEANVISITGTTINIDANAPAGTYTYVIRATDSNSKVTKDATYTITIGKQTVNPVTNVNVTTAGIVTWTASNNATGYEISVSENSGFTSATSGVDYLSTITAAT